MTNSCGEGQSTPTYPALLHNLYLGTSRNIDDAVDTKKARCARPMVVAVVMRTGGNPMFAMLVCVDKGIIDGIIIVGVIGDKTQQYDAISNPDTESRHANANLQ